MLFQTIYVKNGQYKSLKTVVFRQIVVEVRGIEPPSESMPTQFSPRDVYKRQEKTRAALARTINITAWDGGRLAGCLRILTDGCYFGTITELLVLPACRRQGVGLSLIHICGRAAIWKGFGR